MSKQQQQGTEQQGTEQQGTEQQGTEQQGTEQQGTEQQAAGELPKTENQDPAWLGARLERERAKFADYDGLKAKAARLDEIEESNRSELEKAQARADAAEKARAEAQSQALRLRVAVKHGISDEDAELFLTGADEATLTKQAERLAGRAKRSNTHVSGQGNNPPPGGNGTDEKQAVRQLFAASND